MYMCIVLQVFENLHFQYHNALSIIIKIQAVIKLVTIIIDHNFYL